MIVVINPSSGGGHSFKGLNAYCSHDQDQAPTSERVDWIEARNIATNDPAHAWKVMAATAQAQNELKAAAGVRAGRASKHGPVMHVVLSFDKDEPTDPESMQTAADEFLSRLGADPAKMRGKSKPKRRQFADEHQVMMYAHSDTGNAHLHLMINRVHPETGLNLPSNNDQIKAQKWALDYSKRHGTEHKTPARSENMADRDAGEYVKANRRKPRNLYELEKAVEPVNDNSRFTALKEQQAKKDAALALRGRNLAKTQAAAMDRITAAHKKREATINRSTQTQINKARSAIREEFRPDWSALRKDQTKERKLFDELEKSFFGRLSNTAKITGDLWKNDRSGLLKRVFGVSRNAASRREAFEQGQERSQKALQRRHDKAVSEEKKTIKDAQSEKLAQNRAVYLSERDHLKKSHVVQDQALKQDWKTRTAEREQVLMTFASKHEYRDGLIKQHNAATGSQYIEERAKALLGGQSKDAFDRAEGSRVSEQDNTPDRGKDDRER